MAFRATTAFLVGGALVCSGVAAGDMAAVFAQASQATQPRPRPIAAENQGAPGPFDDLIGALRAEIEAGDLIVRRSALEIRLTLDARVHFESGSADLSARGRALLGRLAPALAKFSGHQIIVEGHADNNPILGPLRARYATNWELAAARAVTVARYLTESGGIAPQSVSAASFGEHQPSASNDTSAGRAENRRIELSIARSVPQAPAPEAQRTRSTQRPRPADGARQTNPPPRAPVEASPSAAPAPSPGEDEVDLRR